MSSRENQAHRLINGNGGYWQSSGSQGKVRGLKDSGCKGERLKEKRLKENESLKILTNVIYQYKIRLESIKEI